MLPITISPLDLFRRIGARDDFAIVDVRTNEDAGAQPLLVPGSSRRPALAVGVWAVNWAAEHADKLTVVVCHKGLKLSHGVAAWLRAIGLRAVSLEGGFEAWRQAEMPLVRTDHLPARDATGRTLWVTRAKPKVDRIACPWLIRRFVDPSAVILYVAADEVTAVAERFGAAPFDVPGIAFGHHGDMCSFDSLLQAFGLASPGLHGLAAIVRAADTGREDVVAEAAGLLALSRGLSLRFDDDLAQLAAAIPLYDALYLWCRDGKTAQPGPAAT